MGGGVADGEDVGTAEAAGPFAPVAILVGIVLFFGGLGWPGLIGRIPFGLLLKNELGLPAQQVAWFWAAGTAAWYVKPAVGLLCDAWPLFGTRRRGYLLSERRWRARDGWRSRSFRAASAGRWPR